MQPYQQASEEHRRQSASPFKVLGAVTKTAGSIAGIGAAGAIGTRALSMLSKYIPPEIAAKGLSKIDPRLGKFFVLGQETGASADEVKDYIGQKITSAQAAPSQQARNIIQQIAPELHDFIKEQVAAGRGLHQAGAIAEKDKRFANAITKLTKQHKLSWPNLLEHVYGPAQSAAKGKKGAKPKLAEQEAERFAQQYGDQQTGQPSTANQGLLQAVQAATAARQRRQG